MINGIRNNINYNRLNDKPVEPNELRRIIHLCILYFIFSSLPYDDLRLKNRICSCQNERFHLKVDPFLKYFVIQGSEREFTRVVSFVDGKMWSCIQTLKDLLPCW